MYFLATRKDRRDLMPNHFRHVLRLSMKCRGKSTRATKLSQGTIFTSFYPFKILPR